ncbi:MULTISPECIES: 4-carboxy-4-hydroxy-2-oxoadipate aldolase/oxaloacetate decarboxylase [unclassified Streptomyces]|uniref:4-carboxy-4-hydroxy-2-oxoadipate aldolase/oxaloacetate decarboxylase n=1 Tax=unclassified Streptomyces TaxID=2593676 RepID=UPI00223806DC|nr:4-carboxy-4-hydroxy-2-oxoadipate aldolase/oxaloacetate decarboxylase [Streptomyces sp. SHP 1-2]MCW5254120.1 4-carboxy-4-hydroxy-2-oxoadipate aldolase/oxaloacetate decarboxylase [Streptomyces sp. SHP 1-2]
MTATPFTHDEAELLELGTATLFEAARSDCDLDPGLRPAWPGARLCGTALPVLAAAADNLPLHWALEAAVPGDVLVVDAGGSRCGYWGEVLSVAALARGVRGLVIDGGVRDTAQLERLGFPAFSSSIAIRGTGKEWRGTVGAPVTLRGRTVRRGDLVVADQDGIVVLPAERVDEVVTAARARVEKEDAYMDRLRSGELTLDIYAFRETP